MITLFGGAVQAGTRFDDSLMVIPRFWIENVSHHYYSSLGSNVPITWYIAVKDLDGPLGGSSLLRTLQLRTRNDSIMS